MDRMMKDRKLKLVGEKDPHIVDSKVDPISNSVSNSMSDPMRVLEGMVTDRAIRIAEALLFAANTPLSMDKIAEALPAGTDTADLMGKLAALYADRGVNLVKVAGGFAFRTAPDLSFLVSRETTEPRKIGRAALEILAIIAYHQPVTRAEVEDIRGVATSKGTLDFLLETGWVRMRGRRRTPGRPVTYGTTPEFLSHFSLDRISDLPGVEELKGAGFIEGKLPAGFLVPTPQDGFALSMDEDELEDDMLDTMMEERLNAPDAELDPEDGA